MSGHAQVLIDDQERVLIHLRILRALLDPTGISRKKLKRVRSSAQELGDRCWANVGWHAAQSRPCEDLMAPVATQNLLNELSSLIVTLLPHEKAKAKAGAPSKSSFVELYIASVKISDPRQSVTKLVTRAIQDESLQGWDHPMNKKKKIDAYVKRINRLVKLSHSPRKKPKPDNATLFNAVRN